MKINGIRYHTEVKQWNSSLPNLILLHGFMGSGNVFSPLIRQLRSFCNPVTIDLLGHGKTGSAKAVSRFGLDRQIDDLDQLLDELSEAPPFLYGYSMGGRLALRYALKYPKKLQGLMLESTNDGLQLKDEREQRKKMDKERAQAIENNFPAFLKDWQRLPIFQNGISLRDEKLNRYYNIQQSQDPQQMAMSLRGFGSAEMGSVRDELSGLNLPTLLLAGQADLKYAEINRKMGKKLPNSRLDIIPNAGHRIHLEHPGALAASLQTFIKKV